MWTLREHLGAKKRSTRLCACTSNTKPVSFLDSMKLWWLLVFVESLISIIQLPACKCESFASVSLLNFIMHIYSMNIQRQAFNFWWLCDQCSISVSHLAAIVQNDIHVQCIRTFLCKSFHVILCTWNFIFSFIICIAHSLYGRVKCTQTFNSW